jgi:hypothetical protein
MGESIKSIYKPENPEKYIGNSNNIICRSSWERRACRYFDRNPNVLRWASEEFSIPYVSPKDGKVHRYYPDFLIEIKQRNGKVKKFVVEVKPYKQTKPPVRGKKVTKSFLYESLTYEVNQAKWSAAREFAADNGVEFMILTEKELGLDGPKKVSRKRNK